jgi:hypothetical protein
MKQSFFIDSTDGILKVFTTPVPKEKDYWIESEGFFDSDTYEQAIELAKKEAAEVEGGLTALCSFLKSQYTEALMKMNKGEIYTINMEEEIVKQHQYRAFDGVMWGMWIDAESYNIDLPTPGQYEWRIVARIIPKKAEESEEDILHYILSKYACEYYNGSKSTEERVVTEIREHFEIKRKA